MLFSVIHHVTCKCQKKDFVYSFAKYLLRMTLKYPLIWAGSVFGIRGSFIKTNVSIRCISCSRFTKVNGNAPVVYWTCAKQIVGGPSLLWSFLTRHTDVTALSQCNQSHRCKLAEQQNCRQREEWRKYLRALNHYKRVIHCWPAFSRLIRV